MGDLSVAEEQELLSQLRERWTCPHAPVEFSGQLIIHGVKVDFTKGTHCAECLDANLTRDTTVCGACHQLILPGAPVAWLDFLNLDRILARPYAHLDCNDVPGVPYAGVWGFGKLDVFQIWDPHLGR